ncbi:MAG: hypothetical protein GXO85_09940 [Chlorobi bacterium]|nr:hypothetical protein [Chlorobiota bacterium]
MKNLLKIKIVILLPIIIVILFFTACSESVTSPVENNSISIKFPIGKKAVYAIGTYSGNVDSMEIMFMNIYSLQFDTVLTKGNGLEYIGKVEYTGKSLMDSITSISDLGPTSGKILVSVDEKWVLFQQSEVLGSGQIFLKRDAINTDTTLTPTMLENQFPVFPKKIEPNTFYSVYRPVSADSMYLRPSPRFLAVQRDLDVKDYTEWNDIYGNEKGLYYKTEHVIKIGDDLILNFVGIIDEKGVVVSNYTLKTVISTSEDPSGGDSITTHTINRRIVDFTEPENVKDLSWYADYVIENGLEFLDEK